MQPKYCIDIFGRCPKCFRNRRYEHSLTVPMDKLNRHLRQSFESSGLTTKFLKRNRRKRDYGARINQSFNP